MKPDCLFAHVMKGKDYPHCDFMSASLGSHPSFTWRSIWGARRLLELGMGQRVGNGRSINIWNDVWLPRPGHGKVRIQNIDINYIVADLINRETATQKLEVLRKLFVEEQVNKILTIPAAEVDLDDERVWRGDSIGVFSAKSGYKWLLSEEVTAAQGEMLQQATLLQNFYNKLWKLQVASKIKIKHGKLIITISPCLTIYK